MKYFIVLLFVLIATSSWAQITLEHTYPEVNNPTDKGESEIQN